MAGESAQQRYERIRSRRRAVGRRVLPWILGVAILLAVASYLALENMVPGVGFVGPLVVLSLVIPVFGPSQQEVAWKRGAVGERIVGAALDALEHHGFRTLHDRRMPKSRANLDHIAVGDGVVYTVDAKRYSGPIRVRRGALIINGRDRSKLLDQAERQRTAVRAALDGAGYTAVPVMPVLCFSGVEWPLLFPPRRAGDVRLCSPRGLRRTLTTESTTAASTASLATALDEAFPPVIPPDIDNASPSIAPPARSPSAAAPTGANEINGSEAPNCACGEPMVLRTRRSDGQRFYGCSTFPRCRRTRPYP